MTFRETNLNVFRREPCAGVLWQPRIEHWYHTNRGAGTLPERYREMTLLEVFDDLGCSVRPYWAFNDCFHYDPPEDLRREEHRDGDKTTVIDHTPAGDLVTVLQQTSVASHTLKYPVETPGDMRAIEWVLKHKRVWFDPEAYAGACNEIGDRGAPAIFIPRINIMRITIEFMGFENGTTALYLYPAEMERLIDAINESDDAVLDTVAKSPVEIVNFGDNVHQALCAPPIFEKHVLPEYVRRNKRLHDAGKKTYPHWDGDCKQLLPYARDCGFDGIEAITPVPQGDVTLEEVRDALGGLILLDGIPCTDFLTTEPIEGLVENACKCVEYFWPNLVLGISDEISPVGDIERVRLVSEICAGYRRQSEGVQW
jgi:hypothetical protein